MFTVAQLVETLLASTESSYVRLVAHWLTHGEVTDDEPGGSDSALVDALVAAAVAHLAVKRGLAIPQWTTKRRLDQFWHPGPDAFFANALAQAPPTFRNRGVLIERDSLESV